QPDKVGQKAAGEPTPLPASHYEPEKVNNELALDGRRFVCTQCHVPQAEVDPLVQNTFDKVFETKFKK
ncbi:MAG: nitrate reductase cytochrome c-type subunit, partial [Thiotrichales bacterium]